MKRPDVREVIGRGVKASRAVCPIAALLYSKEAESCPEGYNAEERTETVHALVDRSEIKRFVNCCWSLTGSRTVSLEKYMFPFSRSYRQTLFCT